MGKRLQFFAVVVVASVMFFSRGFEAKSGFESVAGNTTEDVGLFMYQGEVSQFEKMDLNLIDSRGYGTDAASNYGIGDGDNFLQPKTPILASLFEEERTETTEYVVQDGDVLSQIAEDYGVNLQTVISANDIRNIHSIKPGTVLKIPPINGVLHKVKSGDTISGIAKMYSADQEKIINYNSLPLSGNLSVGQEIVVPGGVLKKSSSSSAKSVTVVRKFTGLPVFEGFFKTPATCIITQLYHGRNGVDCANKTGTPIYAAASGKVNLSDSVGYNSGYGKFVRITHSNGTETLYGHFSKIVVETGESVEQGQLIGYMGNTGKSTGPHLHFECHGCSNILSNYKMRASVNAKQTVD